MKLLGIDSDVAIYKSRSDYSIFARLKADNSKGFSIVKINYDNIYLTCDHPGLKSWKFVKFLNNYHINQLIESLVVCYRWHDITEAQGAFGKNVVTTIPGSHGDILWYNIIIGSIHGLTEKEFEGLLR